LCPGDAATRASGDGAQRSDSHFRAADRRAQLRVRSCHGRLVRSPRTSRSCSTHFRQPVILMPR
jgi:hypothetical protein